MIHSKACERADPSSKCKCSCNGKYHGKNFGIHTGIDYPTVEKYLGVKKRKRMDNTKKFIKA